MMRPVPTALLVGMLLVLANANADHFVECDSSEGEYAVTEPAYGQTYYVANDACQPGCTVSLWLYEETNGVPGLQRADETYDETCGHFAPDSAVFLW